MINEYSESAVQHQINLFENQVVQSNPGNDSKKNDTRAPIKVSPPRRAVSPEICLIAAVGPNNELGSENRLPWRLPRDLRFFKWITHQSTVIMGRKTFESLGRPLPNRRNIVITRNPALQLPGATIAHSIQEAIDLCAEEARVFVIGGGKTYRDAMPYATEVFLTKIIDENPSGRLFPLFPFDVTFPDLDSSWELQRRGRKHLALSTLRPRKSYETGMYFFFEIYRRTGFQLPKQSDQT